MYEGEVSPLEGEGKAGQVVGVLLRQVGLGPFCGGAGVGVEVPGVDLADGGPVVISGDGDVIVISQQVDDFGRVGAVADDVAEGPELVDGATGMGVVEDGVKGLEVGVDVGED